MWLEQGEWGHGGRESQEEWGWTDTPGPGGHNKNFAYLSERLFWTLIAEPMPFSEFSGDIRMNQAQALPSVSSDAVVWVKP